MPEARRTGGNSRNAEPEAHENNELMSVVIIKDYCFASVNDIHYSPCMLFNNNFASVNDIHYSPCMLFNNNNKDREDTHLS